MTTSMEPTSRSSRRERGQTAHDFALGMGLFLVTAAFAFSFVPTTLTFTKADPGPKEATQAERAAMTLIGNLSTGEYQNTLNSTATADYFNTTSSEEELHDDLALPVTAQINITIRELGGDVILTLEDSNGKSVDTAAGRDYDQNQPAAEVVRIVTMSHESCDPACQLIVRVW